MSAVQTEGAQSPKERFKAYVIGAEPPGMNGLAGHFPEGEDVTAPGLSGLQALQPLMDPRFLAEVYENSCALYQNVQSYAENIDGHGFRLDPIFNLDADDVDDQIALAMRIETRKKGSWKLGPKPTQKAVDKRKEEIIEQMMAERVRAEAFFDGCAGDLTFTDLRRQTRVDLEVTGNAYWEVIRNGLGEPICFILVPSVSMKLLPLDRQDVEVEQTVRVGPMAEEKIKVRKRFRKFVQEIGRTTEFARVYFKEYGDPRVISRTSGKVYPSLEALEKENANDGPATEIIHFRIFNPRSPYGLPRWHGNMLAAVGTRAAEEVNYYYFDNKSVPPLAILVSGGRLADGSAEQITKFLKEEIRGRGNFHKVLVVEAEPANVPHPQDAGLRARIDLKPLTSAQQQDALFQKYIKDNVDRIGQSFRLPKPLRGDVTEVNRATAEASLRFAEMQVFQPERNAFDGFVNRRLLPELGIRLWKFKSNAPEIRDPSEMSQLVTLMTKEGIILPEEARELAGDIFNKDFKRIDEEWVKLPLKLTLAGVAPGSAGIGIAITHPDDMDRTPGDPPGPGQVSPWLASAFNQNQPNAGAAPATTPAAGAKPATGAPQAPVIKPQAPKKKPAVNIAAPAKKEKGAKSRSDDA